MKLGTFWSLIGFLELFSRIEWLCGQNRFAVEVVNKVKAAEEWAWIFKTIPREMTDQFRELDLFIGRIAESTRLNRNNKGISSDPIFSHEFPQISILDKIVIPKYKKGTIRVSRQPI
jgi:hypothetical protein